MNKLAQKNLEGSLFKGARSIALLIVSFALVACDGANQGVQIGNGQGADPVVVDFPIAYIKAPLPLDDNGDLVQTDVREQITFDFGADLYVKDRASPSSLATNVTGELMQGMAAIRDVEMNYDGSTVIFAMRGPVDLGLNLDDEDQPTWDVWEYAFETGVLRRVIVGDVTAEGGHDVAPHYLSDGRIIFSSTRQRRSNAILVDEGKPQFQAQDEDVNEAAFLLHVMDADGTNIQQVSFNQSHDLDPTVLASGKVVFSRWDHAGQNDAINLYRMNPDGSELELLYGRNSHDTGTNGEIIQFTQPRELEDGRIMSLVRPFTDTNGGGDIIVIDTPTYLENTQPTKDNPGMAGPAQAQATVVEVNTAPGEVSPGGRYNSVYPIQDGTGRLLVSWSQCRLTDIVDPAVQPPVPVVFYPCTDENLINPLYVEADPIYGIWIYDPRDETQLPIVPPEEGFMYTEVASADPRPVPPLILDQENRFLGDPDLVDDGEAVLSIRNVYDFDGVMVVPDVDALANPATTTADQRPARFLRVVKAVSLPDEDDLELENEAFGPNRILGMKEIVGYSMVEPDGSVMMKVPANTALQVSVLDANGRRITARHQNWIQLRPGQLLECNGCHVAQGGMSHGRFDAFDSAYDGADTAGAAFNSGTVDSLFVGDIGETMAEVRARISCGGSDCSSIEPSMDVEYTDVWTDEVKAGRFVDPSFTYSYIDLTTTAPTSVNCITQDWAANCRTVINYEFHIHPIWGADRAILDLNTGLPILDPISSLPLTKCTDCHSLADSAGTPMVPAGQLDLSDGLDILVPEHFNSYRELLFQDDELELDANGVLVPRMIVIGQDVDGNDILATARVNPSATAAGANASNRFFSRFDSAADMHSGFLSDAEKRLIAEWLDVGAQYYNNPFDVPIN